MVDREQMSLLAPARRFAVTKTIKTLIVSLLGSSLAAWARQDKPEPLSFKRFVVWETKHDVSPPLRDMPKYKPTHTKREAEPVRPIPMPPGVTQSSTSSATIAQDSAIQTQSLSPLAATAGLNFDGLG